MRSLFTTYKRPILTTIIVLILLKGSSRQFGVSDDLIEPSWGSTAYNNSNTNTSLPSYSGTYTSITGELLSAPSSQTRDRRSRLMSTNKDYIRGWIYDITYREAKSWMKTISKSTPISLIVEQDKYQQYGDDFGELQKEFSSYNNITLLSDRNLGINNMHAKTFVGEKGRMIQTANLNRSSFYDNREHFFFGTDETIGQNLLDLYTLDTKTIMTKKRYKAEYLTLTDRLAPNLLVCPLNCRQKIESLIIGSKRSIWISAQYITDDRIIQLLRDKSDIDIRILTNDMKNNDDLIRYFGKKIVQFEPKRQYNHDKMIIIDKNIMLVGSMNFSQNALDNNREIGIIILDDKAIHSQYRLFGAK